MSLEDLLDREDLIERMSDNLAKLGYASDAARETQEFLLTLRQFKNRLESIKTRLEPIWKAMEWWESCNYSEDTFKEVLKKYRII